MADPPDDGVSFYSQIAPEFHASYGLDPNRMERTQVWGAFLDRYATNAHSAYDIGCGSGILACELGRRGIVTIGIDGAGGMLRIAENMARARGLQNVTFQQHRLPLANTSGFSKADLVVSSSAIEYLDSIPEALSFINGLLTDQGIALFSVSNREALSRRFVRLVYLLTGHPRYLRFLRHFMTPAEIRAAASSARLTCIEIDYFARADRMNRILGRFFPPRLASNMLIVAARKSATTTESDAKDLADKFRSAQ